MVSPWFITSIDNSLLEPIALKRRRCGDGIISIHVHISRINVNLHILQKSFHPDLDLYCPLSTAYIFHRYAKTQSYVCMQCGLVCCLARG